MFFFDLPLPKTHVTKWPADPQRWPPQSPADSPHIPSGPAQGSGWICPRCGKVWAYWVAGCDCVPTNTSNSTAATTPLVSRPGHGITRCRECDAIIRQCRCIGPHVTEYSLCERCAKLKAGAEI